MNNLWPHLAGVELTARELEYLSLIAQGRTNPQISAQLVVSMHTTKTVLARIFSKLCVNDRAHAVGTAFREGLIEWTIGLDGKPKVVGIAAGQWRDQYQALLNRTEGAA